MSTTDIDFEAVLHALPGAVALMTPDLVFANANEAYLPLSGRTREQVTPARRPRQARRRPVRITHDTALVILRLRPHSRWHGRRSYRSR